MKKNLYILTSFLFTCLSLSSCHRPSCSDWDCSHSRKPKSKSFGFVPLYSEGELRNDFAQDALYDSKEEQLYKKSSQVAEFRNITFATDSYTIKGEDNLTIITNLVRHLQKNPRAKLYIEGHTDERGAAAYNLALGARRANAIKQHLIKQSISADRLFTVSYGKERPLQTGHNELAWQQNRRAEFKIHER